MRRYDAVMHPDAGGACWSLSFPNDPSERPFRPGHHVRCIQTVQVSMEVKRVLDFSPASPRWRASAPPARPPP